MHSSDSKSKSVCRLCLEVSAETLHPAKYLDIFLESVLPTLDLSLSRDPGVCIECRRALTQSYIFKTRCLNNEEKISKYNTSNKPVDLWNLVKDTSCDKRNIGQNPNKNEHNTVKLAKLPKTDDNITEYFSSGSNTNKIRKTKHLRNLDCENILSEVEDLRQTPRNNSNNENFIVTKNDRHIEYHFDCKDDTDHSYYNKLNTANADVEYVEENHCSTTKTRKLEETYEGGHTEVRDNNMDQVLFSYSHELVIENTVEVEGSQDLQSGDHESSNWDNATSGTESSMDNASNFLKVRVQEIYPPPKNQRLIMKSTIAKPFQCFLCSRTFAQKLHLGGHLLTKHSDVADIEKHIESKIHYCNYCQYRTINNYNLASHLVTRHGVVTDESKQKLNMISCAYCSYSTHNRGNLVNHMRTHDTSKSFSCQYCGNIFSQKFKLEDHYVNCHIKQVTHNDTNLLISGRKVYACDICGLKTLDRHRYGRHVKTHTNTTLT